MFASAFAVCSTRGTDEFTHSITRRDSIVPKVRSAEAMIFVTTRRSIRARNILDHHLWLECDLCIRYWWRLRQQHQQLMLLNAVNRMLHPHHGSRKFFLRRELCIQFDWMRWVGGSVRAPGSLHNRNGATGFWMRAHSVEYIRRVHCNLKQWKCN